MQEAVRRAVTGFVVAGIFSLFLNLLMLVSPLYMLQVYDRVLTTGSKETLFYLTLMAIVALAVLGALEGLRTSVLARVGQWIGGAVGGGLVEQSVSGALAGQTSGTQPLRDLSQVRSFIAQGLSVFFDAPWVPIFVALIWILHPWLGVLALSAAIILFCIALANDWLTRSAYASSGKAQMTAMTHADAAVRNAEVVRAMGMQPALLEKWRYFDDSASQEQTRGVQRGGAMLGLSKAIRFAVQVGVLGLGALLVLDGQLTPGGMIAGSILLGRALAPVEQSIGAWRGYVGARAAYERIKELEGNEKDTDESAMPLPAPKGQVSVEAVTFVPPGAEKPVLQQVSFPLAMGDVVGVIGPSGAGKSTLCRLLVGIWPPTRGAVRLDGADLSQLDSDEVGKFIGYLPQDVELFAGTVQENIARMSAGEPQKVVQAAQLADVHEMILRLPQGYDTQIGPQGNVLSGGQRQRIGLARTLYGDPRLVVLDEPNSNLDQAGEAALIATIKRLGERGITTIVVAHRLAALSVVDKLVVLEGGRVSDFGSRQEVLQRLNEGKDPSVRSQRESNRTRPTAGVGMGNAPQGIK